MQQKNAGSSLNGLNARRAQRRVIRVGAVAMTGVVCPDCPAWQETVIYPESGLEAHQERAHGEQASGAKTFARYHNCGAGRPRGAKSRSPMSSTGVEKSAAVRLGRGRR